MTERRETEKNMHNPEQHPVDEWFAQKLQHLEQTPSATSWDALQSRMGTSPQKSSRKGWYYGAAAAAVAVLVGTIWIGNDFFQRPSETETSQVAVEKYTPTQPHRSVAPQTPVSAPARQTEENRIVTHSSSGQKMPGAGMEKPEVRPFKPTVAPEKQIHRETIAKTMVSQKETTTLVQPETATPHVEQPSGARPAEEVWVVVVELPDEQAAVQADSTTPQAAQTLETKVGKIWKTLKKVKKSEIPIEKEDLLTWVRDKGHR